MVQRYGTLEHFCFFSRKQEQKESLEQFWKALNDLLANCEFKGQTGSLVYDIFILKMHKKAVQERLCTEPNTNPDEALQFALASEERVKRQASYGSQNRDPKLEVKTEPISVCTITSDKVGFRCGASNFHNIFHNAEQQKRIEENAVLLVISCAFAGNSSHEYKGCTKQE